jgi:hypothetical protein
LIVVFFATIAIAAATVAVAVAVVVAAVTVAAVNIAAVTSPLLSLSSLPSLPPLTTSAPLPLPLLPLTPLPSLSPLVPLSLPPSLLPQPSLPLPCTAAVAGCGSSPLEVTSDGTSRGRDENICRRYVWTQFEQPMGDIVQICVFMFEKHKIGLNLGLKRHIFMSK